MKAEYRYRDQTTGEEFNLKIDIDVDGLAKKLAIRARRSKHKRASCMFGLVNAKIVEPEKVGR